ncbi:MAG TPA: C40 family peptidase [Mycobacteriales bacterium]|nr:C40 family peptidase [Mycobacteriales bacterium]
MDRAQALLERRAPGWLPERFTSAGLVVALLAVVTLGTGATAVAAVLVSDHHHQSQLSTALPPAPSDALGQLLAPGSTPLPTTPAVPRGAPRRLVTATLLVSGTQPLSHHVVHRLKKLSGVRKVQPLMAGRARVEGHPAFVLGVDPTTFRPWTPQVTADYYPLWKSIDSGELAASFDMGQNAGLPLGGTVPVGDAHGLASIRIGAFASVGMAGVDAVVSDIRAREVGLQPRTGLLVSAPKADPLELRRTVLGLLGHHTRVELLREVVIVRDSGEFLTRLQIANFLRAAESRIGLPYVWGAAGPATFDCSGLVQWAFAYAGVRMPRVSEEQWFTGPHIPYANARPGDLLFWHYDQSDPTDIDHVAIYAGNGMMIVAPHTGEYVSYEPVPLSNLAGVVRVDPVLGSELA